MKRIIIPTSILHLTLLVLFLTGCMPAMDEAEETTLSIDKTELSLPKDAGEASVNVSTNQSSWTAFKASDEAWLSLSRSGNTLQVKVTPNDLGSERSAIIIVSAGTMKQKLLVRQSQADVTIETFPKDIIFGMNGGTRTIDVKSNAGEWSFEAINETDSWLTLEENPKFGYITLRAEYNESDEARKVSLIVKSGSATKEVVVSQEGRESFFLPLNYVGAAADQILRFETERGSEVMPNIDLRTMNYVVRGLMFTTPYATIPMVIYKVTPNDRHYTECIAYCTNPKVVDDLKFKNFITKNKFTLEKQWGNLYRFVSDEKKLVLMIEQEEGMSVWTYSPYWKQAGPMKTFNHLNLEIPTEILSKNQESTLDDVATLEDKDPKSKLYYKPEDSESGVIEGAFYRVTGHDNYTTERCYWCYLPQHETNGVGKTGVVYRFLEETAEWEIMYWDTLDNGNKYEYSEHEWVIVNEFYDLVIKSGFKPVGKDIEGYYIFVHPELNLTYIPSTASYIGAGKRVGNINVFRLGRELFSKGMSDAVKSGDPLRMSQAYIKQWNAFQTKLDEMKKATKTK